MGRIAAVLAFVLYCGEALATPAARSLRNNRETNDDIADYSHVVQVRARNGVFVGGASIITDTFALSAAHFLQPADPREFYLLGGSASISGTDDVQFLIDKLILHPSYDATTKNCDVSLVRIVGSFLQHPNVAAIPLQNTFISSTSDTDCTVFGWAPTPSGNVSDTLQMTLMQAVPQANCVHDWALYRTITPQMICVESAATDVCKGDNGGGLICSGRLAGVASWNTEDCIGHGPVIFAKVSSYDIRKFIRDHSGV